MEQIIYAITKLKKHQDSFVLLIIGRGELEQFYKKIIKDNRLKNQVYIVGEVAPHEIMSYYTICDFLVHPSIIDSFSMACLEAMSAGKPFICTKNIGITEYIKNNKEAFIISPDHLNQLVEKIDILLSNSKLRKKMGKAAYQTSLKFQSNNLKYKFIEIYEEFIKTK
ncbi:MAG: glycosyltransferase [bacterium]|nr:glycosyltransferase [bacterium]